jgi:hypothetical protein
MVIEPIDDRTKAAFSYCPLLIKNLGDSGIKMKVTAHAIKAGREQTAANHLQFARGMIRLPDSVLPNMIHAIVATNIAPTIQKDATIDSNLPLEAVGNISAPRENTVGIDPPMPIPAAILMAIKVEIPGEKADINPASALRPSEKRRQGLLPILSDNIPLRRPPTNIPIKTAAPRNSKYNDVMTFSRIDPEKKRFEINVHIPLETCETFLISARTKPTDIISTASAAFPSARHNV